MSEPNELNLMEHSDSTWTMEFYLFLALIIIFSDRSMFALFELSLFLDGQTFYRLLWGLNLGDSNKSCFRSAN